MNTKEKLICYLDVLGICSLFTLWRLSSRYDFAEVRYCRAAGVMRFPLVRNLFSKRFKEFRYELGNIFWKENEGIFWLEYEELTPLCLTIGGTLPIDGLDERYNKERLRLYLTQKISLETDEVLRLILIARYATSSAKCLVLTRRLPWSRYLKEYGDKYSVSTVNYFYGGDWVQPFFIFFKFLAEGLVNLLLLPVSRFAAIETPAKPLIGVCYLNGIDENKRNDLPWFQGSVLSADNILIYFKSSVHPLTPAIREKIEQRGFRYVNLSAFDPQNPLSKITRKINIFPTPDFLAGILAKLGALFTLGLKVPGKNVGLRIWQWNHLSLLLNKVNFYESFFRKFNVGIHFSLFGLGDDQTASNIAMDIKGGADVTTHWSNFPMVLLDQVSNHDVYFAWGPHYEKFFKTSSHLVYSGYIYSGTFAATVERAVKHRQALQQAGARFIVSFFDEKYDKNGWLVISLIEESYCALLKKVLDDTTFGLIIKTKKISSVLGLNNPQLNSLLKSAMETKRCLLFDQNQLPNEAGQASDLAVGLGVFNTAVLECAFAGVPFLTIDHGGMRAYPYYRFGLNKIVFNTVEEAIAVLEKFKDGRQELKEVLASKELSAVLKEIDPFQDGKTAERISFYIKTLLNAFTEGKSKEDALATANRLYAEKHTENFASQNF